MTDETAISAGGRLTIDLGALCANYRRFAAEAGQACTAAVVKADAYGLGADRVAPALAGVGCRDFFVAHLGEALPLRARLPDDATLFVLNGLQPGAEAACAAAGVIPVLNSLEQAANWTRHGAQLGRRLAAAIQVDSGMARLGLPAADAATLAADRDFAEHVRPVLVMSHLACADERGSPANTDQPARFAALAALFPGVPRALANSAGIFLEAGLHQDMVRPGVGLYGAAPQPDRPGVMAPVVRLDARVIQVRPIEGGAGVGYGLTYARSTSGQIATIAVGYADGWPRSLSNRGAAYFKGVRLPIAGRVSMDSITLDVTALSERGLSLRLGDEVELLGPNQTLEAVAEAAGTIPYEILTSLGRRYHRLYVEGPPVRPTVESPVR
jgi:alanine racemase